MSAKDRIDQQEQEQSLSEMSASLERLASNQNEMLTAMQRLIESQSSLTSMVEELSTSVQSDASSNAPDATLKLGGVKKRLTSLEEAVTALAESLASSQTVQLADGSSLKKSDVEALTLMEKTAAQIADLRSSLLSEMASKAQLRIDYDKLAAVLASKLETSLSPQITESTQRVEETLKAHERHLDALGGKKVEDVKESLQEATKGLERAERTASQLRGALTWAGVGKVALALLPLALVGLAVAMVLGIGGQLFGVGPVFGWAWASFAAAEAWWLKLIIAVVTVTGALGVCWVVYRLGRKLAEVYRGW